MFSQGQMACVSLWESELRCHKWLCNEPGPDWPSDPLFLFCVGMPGADRKEMAITRYFTDFMNHLYELSPGF